MYKLTSQQSRKLTNCLVNLQNMPNHIKSGCNNCYFIEQLKMGNYVKASFSFHKIFPPKHSNDYLIY